MWYVQWKFLKTFRETKHSPSIYIYARWCLHATVRVNNCPGFFFWTGNCQSWWWTALSAGRRERPIAMWLHLPTSFQPFISRKGQVNIPPFVKKKRKDPVVEGYSLELLVKVTYVASNWIVKVWMASLKEFSRIIRIVEGASLRNFP